MRRCPITSSNTRMGGNFYLTFGTFVKRSVRDRSKLRKKKKSELIKYTLWINQKKKCTKNSIQHTVIQLLDSSYSSTD